MIHNTLRGNIRALWEVITNLFCHSNKLFYIFHQTSYNSFPSSSDRLRRTDRLIHSDIFIPRILLNALGCSATRISLVNTNSIGAVWWSSQVNINDWCQTVTRENSSSTKIWLIPRALSFRERMSLFEQTTNKTTAVEFVSWVCQELWGIFSQCLEILR